MHMSIKPIVMPKWGLSMEEGILTKWSVAQGQEIHRGQELADIETTKLANIFESPIEGHLRRCVATEGQTLPVGALIAVVADTDVGDQEIDEFIVAFQQRCDVGGAEASGGPEPRMIDAGRPLRVLSLGAGDETPIVLIHGFGSDLGSWLFNQEALSEDRMVHALDLPGHGSSDKDVGDGSLQHLSAAVLAAMDCLGVDRAHLVGHSLGGAIAAHLAAEAQERVASVTLIAPAGLGPEIAGQFIDGFIDETRSRKLRPVVEMLVANPDLITVDMIEDVLKFKRIDGAADALKRIANANFPGGTQINRLADGLATSQIPVLSIVGDADRIIRPSHVNALPSRAKSIRLTNVGHLPHMERSADVNDAIKNFVNATIP
jgi:pyruvate dehydrogenase E2 component (dihydrolipoamide acetyltransferase)